MPPQLFRRIRASSHIDEDEDAFNEYKVIMEEIKQEHPDLPLSAVQQMAVERFSIIKEKRLSQNSNSLMTAMSNFRFGKGKKAPTDPTTNDNDTNDPEDRRKSLNPRISVPNIDTKSMMTQSFLGGFSSDDEDSLEDSLNNIEASTAPAPPRRQPSRRGRRGGSLKKHASLNMSSTELVDVQEDKVLHASIPESLAHSTDRTQSSNQDLNSAKNSPGPQKSSISDDLPDEIKVALGEYDIDDGQRSSGSDDKSQGRRRSRMSESSIASSFASVDSANFEGDFSAWGSKRSLLGE
mmetsp:Transcript_37942/g.77520  ORF Transcript_37942/g.77520 Transcript_37942/m.77520 type:complete len:294 (-) Transcript_37942:134-1015(-)